MLASYGAATEALIGATAALTELSDDGAMLRSISATVALLDLEERASVEHAIVDNAAARGELAPGSFRALVTTATEAGVYEASFRASAPDDLARRD